MTAPPTRAFAAPTEPPCTSAAWRTIARPSQDPGFHRASRHDRSDRTHGQTILVDPRPWSRPVRMDQRTVRRPDSMFKAATDQSVRKPRLSEAAFAKLLEWSRYQARLKRRRWRWSPASKRPIPGLLPAVAPESRHDRDQPRAMSGNQQHPDMTCEVFILGPTDFVERREKPTPLGDPRLPVCIRGDTPLTSSREQGRVAPTDAAVPIRSSGHRRSPTRQRDPTYAPHPVPTSLANSRTNNTPPCLCWGVDG
jgi:hypothetical protein